MKNFSVKVELKKRKIRVRDNFYWVQVRIDGLSDFEVSLLKYEYNSDVTWNCHGGTYQITNVLTQIFGEKRGRLEITQEDGGRLIDTLLNTLETLGHEVVYEKASEI